MHLDMIGELFLVVVAGFAVLPNGFANALLDGASFHGRQLKSPPLEKPLSLR